MVRAADRECPYRATLSRAVPRPEAAAEEGSAAVRDRPLAEELERRLQAHAAREITPEERHRIALVAAALHTLRCAVHGAGACTVKEGCGAGLAAVLTLRVRPGLGTPSSLRRPSWPSCRPPSGEACLPE